MSARVPRFFTANRLGSYPRVAASLWLAGLLLLLSGGAAAATDRGLETISEPPELPERLAALLPAEGHRVLVDGQAIADFWLLDELPATEPTGELGIDFGQIPSVALVGVVELKTEWSDYKKQPIPAGLYTLRYAVQPADGDHTGQSYFRDFLMLLPAAEDEFPVAGGIETDEVVDRSTDAAGSEHPAVIALYQIWEPVDGVSLVANDYGEPCLAVPLGDVVMGLVLEGFGHGLQVG